MVALDEFVREVQLENDRDSLNPPSSTLSYHRSPRNGLTLGLRGNVN